jgi:rhamnosyltransferase
MIRKYAVIPFYDGDIKKVQNDVSILNENGWNVIVVNNLNYAQSSLGEVVINNDNLNGIAGAFNVALKYIRNDKEFSERKAYILFLDQDSIVDGENLQLYMIEIEKYPNFAIYGAMPIDANGRQYRTHSNRHTIESNSYIINPSFIISSYSLIPLETFDVCGDYLETLFIDSVDYEYSLRVRQKELNIVILKNIRFIHTVGVKSVLLLGKRVVVSSPFRNYYQVRNVILISKLYKLNMISTTSKVFKRIMNCIVSVLYDYKAVRIKYLIRGIVDGIKGV